MNPLEYYGIKDPKEQEQILSIERRVMDKIIKIKTDSYEIGKMLSEAKQILPHGRFKQWIEDVFDKELPYSSAHFYMRIYENFKGKKHMVKHFPTELLLVLTQNKFPDEAFKLIMEEVENNPDKLSPQHTKAVKKLYEDHQNGLTDSDEFEKEVDEVIKYAEEDFKEEEIKERAYRCQHRYIMNQRRSLYFGIRNHLSKLNNWVHKARRMNIFAPHAPDDPTHQDIIDKIDDTIREMRNLQKELEERNKLFRKISTPGGIAWANELNDEEWAVFEEAKKA